VNSIAEDEKQQMY